MQYEVIIAILLVTTAVTSTNLFLLLQILIGRER